MEIKQTINNSAGLNTSTEKKADTAPTVSLEKDSATEKGSATQNTGELSTVTVTDSALKLQQIEKTLAEIPSFNAEKVERIKQALSEGSYIINTDRIADKLIDFEQNLF